MNRATNKFHCDLKHPTKKEMNMTETEKAFAFSTSMRGQYIISQALCLAIDMMSAVEPEQLKEQSNISDMEYLRDNIYPMFHIVQQTTEKENTDVKN